MTETLENKVAILFGAGSVGPGWGNGKATAVLFARNGAHVICIDIKSRRRTGNGGHHSRGRASGDVLLL
jgi:NAD(P)-dependent dehydrogenase (short-subunit alcohol dehydrogenase family)